MALETIEVLAGGRAYKGWKSVEIVATFEGATRTFTLNVSDVSDAPFDKWPLFPGTPVHILASGSLAVNGFISAFSIEGSAQSHEVTLTGEAVSMDLVKSSPNHATGYVENKTVLQIAQELVAPLGVPVETDSGAIP